ncbi:MAG: hypothetical protein QGG02_01730 [Gammaproteobacteria bacterium]|jgi:hypothetical protein|nr:hypothetical protein [Gammaproteobacteria bacterium]MDP6733247.1 hypothetical protein [Gammaproteobacteria bacterium]
MINNFLRKLILVIQLLVIGSVSSQAIAHGSVGMEDDRCLISINFMQAHFTVFQPESRDNEEFCEDIPDVSRSVFVMEYLHDLLRDMRIDFRIIRDLNSIGQFASWEDIEAIEDLEAVTVYYERQRIESGGFYTASYEIDSPGSYLGIVTAEHPTEDRNYNAVFYFQVGGADLGTIPIFIALLLLLQGGYWLSNGGYQKLRARSR